MMATLVNSIIALGLTSGAMSRLRPGVFNTSPPEYDAVTWRRTAVPLMIITAAEARNRTGVVLFWAGSENEAGRASCLGAALPPPPIDLKRWQVHLRSALGK